MHGPRLKLALNTQQLFAIQIFLQQLSCLFVCSTKPQLLAERGHTIDKLESYWTSTKVASEALKTLKKIARNVSGK